MATPAATTPSRHTASRRRPTPLPFDRVPETNEVASYWRSRPDTITVSVDELICPGGTSPAVADGVQTHVDTNHLTIRYSRAFADQLDAYLRAHGVVLAEGEAEAGQGERSSPANASSEPTA